MSRLKRPITIFASSGFAVLLIVLALMIRPQQSPISVEFVGYTNNSKGSLRGLIRLRNKTEKHLVWVATMPYLTNAMNGWKWSGPRKVHIITLMGADESRVIEIPAPSNQVWRAAVASHGNATHRLREDGSQWLNKVFEWDRDFWGPISLSKPIAPANSDRTLTTGNAPNRSPAVHD